MTIVLFFNDTATTEIYTLSLHDALPIFQLLDLGSFHVLEPGVDPGVAGHVGDEVGDDDRDALAPTQALVERRRRIAHRRARGEIQRRDEHCESESDRAGESHGVRSS